MSAVQNHSKYYYVSNQNMSDIKESIEEYSMNFQNQSGLHGNSKSQISEMISGSHQVTQSRAAPKAKPPPARQPVIIEEQVEDNLGRGDLEEGKEIQSKKAVYLGDHVYNTIRERYFQTNKITTDDPHVLYDFFLAQRKTLSSMKPIKQQEIMKQMPSMQRKLLVKQQFQRILTYYPDDVLYSLHFEAEKIKKDRQLTQKVQYLNRGAKKETKKATKKDVDKIVEKLYKTKGNFNQVTNNNRISDEEIEKMRRTKFGRNLSEHFQNTYRERGAPMNIQTAQKLHSFWEDVYERQQFGIEWEEQTAKQTIHQYMYDQIEDLMNYANRKLGFKCGKAVSLYKFYTKNFDHIENIYIPLNSFQEYVKEYNNAEKKKMEEQEDKAKQNYNKQLQKRKKSQVKKFGRPVSATPLTVLSKPKTKKTHIDELYEKYPKDKVIKAIVAEQNLKKPRYPMEYGLYDIQDQVKTKQWIRIDPKKPQEKYDLKIHEQLYKTFTSPNFHEIEKRDRLMDLFAEQDVYKDEHWKQLSPLMHQAMLVKAYEHKWFTDCIQRYVQRTTGENMKLQTNNVLMKKLFKHLDTMQENKRDRELQNLQTLILTSESIAEKTEKINNLANKKMSERQEQKERRLLFVKLEQKALEYVKMRINKTDQKFMLRNYLNALFQEVLKEHREYVKKQYHVVEGCQKECPKLLKYQFFRLVKEVNPMILQIQPSKKSHVWVPTKSTPETINYKSFNTFTEYYKKEKNIILAQPEKDELKHSLWGRKKGQDRQNLMMTYNDSKECTFQPRFSRKL